MSRPAATFTLWAGSHRTSDMVAQDDARSASGAACEDFAGFECDTASGEDQ